MSVLVTGLILLLTIFTVLGVGVLAGQYLLTAILHLMGHRHQTPEAPALATSEAHGGD